MFRYLPLPLLLLLFSLILETSQGNEIYISNPDGLIGISNVVNSDASHEGKTYSGTTVFLENDIDFSGKTMEPIGNDVAYSFGGVFDGQGYVISNLKISMKFPSDAFIGLFGYSKGTIIKNVVLDSSCSIEISYSDTGYDTFMGGIMGYCYSMHNKCVLENIVNIASVTFSEYIKHDLHLGGIVGVAHSFKYDISITNCVNYGTVTHNGTVGGYCDVGGIAGHFTEGTKYIQNCLNYGAIRHIGSTIGYKYIGGIVGFVRRDGPNKTVIENCMSASEIEVSNKTNSSIGNVMGRADDNTNITHCFWTSDTGCDDVYGLNEGGDVTIEIARRVELNTTILSKLNEYSERGSSWNKWIMFHLNGGTINSIKRDVMVVTNKYFPDPVKEGKTFLFWCEDNQCDAKYDPSTSSATELYAIWNTSTLTFDYGNGTAMNVTYQFSDAIEYPNVAREGYTFSGWSPKPDKMPGCDTTTIAQWIINNYTLSFDFDNGTIINNILNYSDSIIYPENVMREEYTFSGWIPNPGKMPANDTVITAQWIINNYTLTFDYMNGTIINNILNYSDSIVYPENITREGYTFNGWIPNPGKMPANDTVITASWIINNYTLSFDLNNGTIINNILNYNEVIYYPSITREGYKFFKWDSSIKAMPAHSITITAQWIDITNSSNSVEIVFEKKDISEREAREIIKAYTDGDDSFVIEKVNDSESTFIIKFVDAKEAENFVENISASSEVSKQGIKDVSFITTPPASTSSSIVSPLINILIAL